LLVVRVAAVAHRTERMAGTVTSVQNFRIRNSVVTEPMVVGAASVTVAAEVAVAEAGSQASVELLRTSTESAMAKVAQRATTSTPVAMVPSLAGI
jgi:hypothetical protein